MRHTLNVEHARARAMQYVPQSVYNLHALSPAVMNQPMFSPVPILDRYQIPWAEGTRGEGMRSKRKRWSAAEKMRKAFATDQMEADISEDNSSGTFINSTSKYDQDQQQPRQR